MNYKNLLAEADATLIYISTVLETDKNGNATYSERFSDNEKGKELVEKESGLVKLSNDCAKKGDIEKARFYAAELQDTNKAAALLCHSFASSQAGDTTRALGELLKAIILFVQQGFEENKFDIVT